MVTMNVKMIFVVAVLLVAMENASACRRNSQCSSGWCEGGGVWKSGRCISKRYDGQHCYNGDANSCISRQCTCGLCGRKQNGGAACATNDNCHSNWCEKGSWSFGCSGRCIAKRADGQACHNGDGNSCVAGQCTCGSCGRHLAAGKTCATNDNCVSRWCEKPPGRLGCGGTCQRKRNNGEACYNGDANSCAHSNQCTCGRCGAKQGNGATCATNANCYSNWCERPHWRLGCSGRCQNKRADGQSCHNGDGNSCVSGQCTCGTCGVKVPNGKSCSTNANCQSDWCNPKVTIGCSGKCKRKAYDYEGCVDGNHCTSGRCEGVSRSASYCAPKNGFKLGFKCNEDTDCDVTKSYWCKGGSAFTTGSCTQCPSECKDGCNALFDQGLSCGRKNTWDHVGDIIMCVAGVPDLAGCAKEFAGVITSCIDGSCDVTIGGPGKKCLSMGKELKYTKSYGSGAPTLRFTGSIKANAGLQLGLGLTIPSRMDMSMHLHGTIAIHAKAELSFEKTKTKTITKRIELAKPKVLFRKVIQAGPMPIMIILRIQPVAYAELTTSVSATGSLSFSYDNPEALTLRDVGIEVKDFKPTVSTPELSIDLNKDIVPEISIKGEVSVMGFLRIGPEIVIEVNGMPFTFYPSVHVKLGTALQYSYSNGKHCLYGEIRGGIGIDAGIKGPLSILTPSVAASSACMMALNAACMAIEMNPKARVANCVSKQITKKDFCKKEGPEQCTKLASEIEKVEPKNLLQGLDEFSKEIMKPKEIVKSVSIGDCSDVGIDYGTGGGIKKVNVKKTITTKTTSPRLIIMCHHNRNFPLSYAGGRTYKGGVTESKFKSTDIITWENTNGRSGGCQWIGWSSRVFANQNLRISFWIKFVGSVPPKGGNFGMKVYGVIHNKWVSKCHANKWCYVWVVTRCPNAGDGNHVILIFDSINRRQTVRVAQLQVQIVGAGKDAESEEAELPLNDEDAASEDTEEVNETHMEDKISDDEVHDGITFDDYYGATLLDNEKIVSPKHPNDQEAVESTKPEDVEVADEDVKSVKDLDEASNLETEIHDEASKPEKEVEATKPKVVLDDIVKPATKDLDGIAKV